MKRKLKIKKKGQNRLGMLLVFSVVLMLLAVVSVKSAQLREKQLVYQERIDQLEEQIDKEEKQKETLVEYKKYTQTKKFAEEVAKDKLGLVHENEIIFKADE